MTVGRYGDELNKSRSLAGMDVDRKRCWLSRIILKYEHSTG